MSTTATVRRLAFAAAVLGLLLALLLFAPARWLASALDRASGGQVQLVNARGSVWSGQADLLLTGGEAALLRPHLPPDTRMVDNLVLYGLASVADGS